MTMRCSIRVFGASKTTSGAKVETVASMQICASCPKVKAPYSGAGVDGSAVGVGSSVGPVAEGVGSGVDVAVDVGTGSVAPAFAAQPAADVSTTMARALAARRVARGDLMVSNVPRQRAQTRSPRGRSADQWALTPGATTARMVRKSMTKSCVSDQFST